MVQKALFGLLGHVAFCWKKDANACADTYTPIHNPLVDQYESI
jgi:hypothetical protein